MHWAQESARWSNWPGRASTARTLWGASGTGKVSSYTSSTWGSEKTTVLAASYTSGAMRSASYRFRMRTPSRASIPSCSRSWPHRPRASTSKPGFFSE